MSKLHKGKKLSQEQRQFLSDRMADTNIKSKMIEKVTEKIREKYEDPIFRQKIVDTRCRGEDVATAMFTITDVLLIRTQWEALDKSARGSIRRFCVEWANKGKTTKEAVYAIVKRRTWKHV